MAIKESFLQQVERPKQNPQNRLAEIDNQLSHTTDKRIRAELMAEAAEIRRQLFTVNPTQADRRRHLFFR